MSEPTPTKPLAELIALPLAVETENGNSVENVHNRLVDANGKNLADSFNSDLTVIETESDGEGGTDYYEIGTRAAFEGICRAVNAHDDLVNALEASNALMEKSMKENIDTEDVYRCILRNRPALAKAKGGAS